jgi:leucyl-tRNA synthetase
MLNARDEYRAWCKASGVAMHGEVIRRWAESIVILICPICPHWSEMMWKKLGKDGLAVKAAWPVAGEEDKLLTRQAKFLRDSLKAFRSLAGKAKKGWGNASVLVSDSYPQWKIDTINWMQGQYKDGKFADSFMKDLKDWSAKSAADKKMIKFTMQFASFMKNEVADVGPKAMDVQLPFDQKTVLEESLKYLQSQLAIPEIDIIKVDEENGRDVPSKFLENVAPGKPSLWFR